MDLLLTGKPINAETALRYGLVNRVVPKDQLQTVTEDLAAEIASKPADVIALGKRAFYDQLERRSLIEAYEFAGQIMADNMLLKNANEGISAFLEKRKPTWDK